MHIFIGTYGAVARGLGRLGCWTVFFRNALGSVAATKSSS